MHTNGQPGLCFFFTQVMDVFVFFGCLYRPYLSDKKHTPTVVGLCIVVVSKTNFRTHCIERGMINLHLWQWLGWLSSYFLSLHFFFTFSWTCTLPVRVQCCTPAHQDFVWCARKSRTKLMIKKKREHPHTAVRGMCLLAKKWLSTPIPMIPEISRNPGPAHPAR